MKDVRTARSIARLIAVPVAALLLAGCSSSATEGTAQQPAAAAESPTAAAPSAPKDAKGTTIPDPVIGASGAPEAPPGGGSTNGTGTKANPTPGPAPMIDIGHKTPIKVESTLEPLCVSPGETMSLDVTSRPKAAIVYQAVYADGYGGAGPPFGKGYGGNDKGYTSGSGEYSSSWVVSPNTPSGPARVDVIVAYGGKYGQDGPHFAVADSNGDCDEKWLREDDEDEAKGSK